MEKSKVVKVTGFKTTDGSLHEKESNALKRQAELDFKEWYRTNELFGNYQGSIVELGILKEWLKDNSKEVLAFLCQEG